MLAELLARDPRTSLDVLRALASDPDLSRGARAHILAHPAGPPLGEHADLGLNTHWELHRVLTAPLGPQGRARVLAAQHPALLWENICRHDDLSVAEIAAVPRARSRTLFQHIALVANRRSTRAQVLRSIKSVGNVGRFTVEHEALILGAADRHELTRERLPHTDRLVDGAQSPGSAPWMTHGARVERPAPHLDRLMWRLARRTHEDGDAPWDDAIRGCDDAELSAFALSMVPSLTSPVRVRAIARAITSSSRAGQGVRRDAALLLEPEPVDAASAQLDGHRDWPLTATQLPAALALEASFPGPIWDLVTAAAAVSA